jgi:Uma2 family endonuclease
MASLLYGETGLLTVEEFLEIDFGSDRKAELDNGVIRMMAGGSARHAAIQANLLRFLGNALRGSGCRPYGSDMGLKPHNLSLRYPDVSVYCHGDDPDLDSKQSFDDPQILFEILSAGTARTDLRVKLEEYKAVPSVQTIVFVDTASELVRILQRTDAESWSDLSATSPRDVGLPSLKITIPHTEIFARD